VVFFWCIFLCFNSFFSLFLVNDISQLTTLLGTLVEKCFTVGSVSGSATVEEMQSALHNYVAQKEVILLDLRKTFVHAINNVEVSFDSKTAKIRSELDAARHRMVLEEQKAKKDKEDDARQVKTELELKQLIKFINLVDIENMRMGIVPAVHEHLCQNWTLMFTETDEGMLDVMSTWNNALVAEISRCPENNKEAGRAFVKCLRKKNWIAVTLDVSDDFEWPVVTYTAMKKLCEKLREFVGPGSGKTVGGTKKKRKTRSTTTKLDKTNIYKLINIRVNTNLNIENMTVSEKHGSLTKVKFYPIRIDNKGFFGSNSKVCRGKNVTGVINTIKGKCLRLSQLGYLTLQADSFDTVPVPQYMFVHSGSQSYSFVIAAALMERYNEIRSASSSSSVNGNGTHPFRAEGGKVTVTIPNSLTASNGIIKNKPVGLLVQTVDGKTGAAQGKHRVKGVSWLAVDEYTLQIYPYDCTSNLWPIFAGQRTVNAPPTAGDKVITNNFPRNKVDLIITAMNKLFQFVKSNYRVTNAAKCQELSIRMYMTLQVVKPQDEIRATQTQEELNSWLQFNQQFNKSKSLNKKQRL